MTRSRADGRPAGRSDQRSDKLSRTKRPNRGPSIGQARPQAVPAHHPRRAAARGQAEDQTETNLDGKYLLRCSDPHLSAEDIALGYKQLLEVERGWRDMKQILDLRPVYHRREDRIRAHVLLCWLALLLIRVAETSTGDLDLEPAPRRAPAPARGHLHRPCRDLPAAHRAGKPQRDILTALGLDPPKKIIEIIPKP